jgi:hypothetical protein
VLQYFSNQNHSNEFRQGMWEKQTKYFDTPIHCSDTLLKYFVQKFDETLVILTCFNETDQWSRQDDKKFQNIFRNKILSRLLVGSWPWSVWIKQFDETLCSKHFDLEMGMCQDNLLEQNMLSNQDNETNYQDGLTKIHKIEPWNTTSKHFIEPKS